MIEVVPKRVVTAPASIERASVPRRIVAIGIQFRGTGVFRFTRNGSESSHKIVGAENARIFYRLRGTGSLAVELTPVGPCKVRVVALERGDVPTVRAAMAADPYFEDDTP